jgi:hypothetical protein
MTVRNSGNTILFQTEPIANQAANAFGAGSIPGNIAIIDDIDDIDLIWGNPNSGG